MVHGSATFVVTQCTSPTPLPSPSDHSSRFFRHRGVFFLKMSLRAMHVDIEADVLKGCTALRSHTGLRPFPDFPETAFTGSVRHRMKIDGSCVCTCILYKTDDWQTKLAAHVFF